MGRRPYALVAALLPLVVLVGCDHPSQPHRASPAPVGSASPARPAATGLTGRIAYNTEDGDLWVMNADGSGRLQVTHSGDRNDFDPSWSPNGRRIVFRTSRGAHLPDTASIGLDGIFVVNADGSGERPIHPPTGGLFPDWSPDGQWIAFSGVQPPSDRPDYLYVMRPDGTGVRPVSTALASECAEWSPDGSKIAFCGHWGSADSDFDVGLMNADGSHVLRLTNAPGHDYPGAWSPDGTRLAFSSDRNGSSEVWIMNVDGTHQRRLIHTPGAGEAPNAWLPDGRIVISSAKPDQVLPDWYLIRPDGTGIMALPQLHGAQSPIDWLPCTPRTVC